MSAPDLDDLFGEDSEGEQNELETTVVNEEGDNEANEDSEINEDEDDNDKEREIHAIDLDLAKHPCTLKLEDDEMYFANLPAFLNVDPMPFDAPAFKEQIQEQQRDLNEEDKRMEKLFSENVIRWRYNKIGDKVYKQLNCHFVEWSDGLISLKLGKEIFDVVRNPVSDHFLTIRHNELEIFQTDSIFSKNMRLIPSLTNLEIHKKLTEYIKKKSVKNDVVNSALLDEDPELVLKRQEKEEEEMLRSARRLELKRMKEEERGESKSRRTQHSQFETSLNEGYFDDDEDDDFVAGDDEEIVSADDEDDLERSERLTRIKEGGRGLYDDDDEETESRVKKRRRVIEDDEDDE